MVPPGESELDPAVNVVQSLVAAPLDGQLRVALYQNTPVQFHGLPHLTEQLTQELHELL
jgi:hypothetical protein